MSTPKPPRPTRRALHDRQSNGRVWLVIGILITWLSFAHATLAAGTLPRGGTYVAGTGRHSEPGERCVACRTPRRADEALWGRDEVPKRRALFIA
jgi:hypothetical protein